MQVPIKNNLKTVLDSKGMTPYRLAQMLGKHVNHVYTFANNDVIPDGTNLRTMVDISRALQVPVDQLFTVVDED